MSELASMPVRLGLRALLALGALSAATYAVGRIPVEVEADPLVALSSRLVGGLDFDVKALTPFEPVIRKVEDDPACGQLRNPASVFRIYRMQQAAGSGDSAAAFENGEQAVKNLRAKLACGPQDGNSWFNLFLLESALSGRAGRNLPFLRMSYEVAPNEGWISQTRAPIAIAFLRNLDPDLRARVEAEYVHVARDAPDTAAEIFAKTNEANRALLLPLFERVPVETRKLISDKLAEGGTDVRIPGVPDPTNPFRR